MLADSLLREVESYFPHERLVAYVLFLFIYSRLKRLIDVLRVE